MNILVYKKNASVLLIWAVTKILESKWMDIVWQSFKVISLLLRYVIKYPNIPDETIVVECAWFWEVSNNGTYNILVIY